MNYIVLDLEWNQNHMEQEVSPLPFEIMEIGAVKLSEECVVLDKFTELIKPQIYHEINAVVGQLVHMEIEELEKGLLFQEAAEKFLAWCGEDYLFCTWGSSDLTELQKNMKFYNMPVLSEGPLAFLDVQKLFSIAYEDRKHRRSLEYAVDFLTIEKEIPFHRAFSDAYYTAQILADIYKKEKTVFKNISYDTFHPPQNRKEEVKKQFDTYVKYISRKFDDKTEAFADPEVISSKCYLCHRNLRKKIKWFSANGRNYYSVAYCEKHGYLKGKIRVRKSDDDKVYIVKTNKFIPKEEVEAIEQRKIHARELRKRRKPKEENTDNIDR